MPGEEVSCSCGQTPAPAPTGGTKPQPITASEQASTGFKMYVSPKSDGTVCHTPYTAAPSIPPVPVISVVVVESL